MATTNGADGPSNLKSSENLIGVGCCAKAAEAASSDDAKIAIRPSWPKREAIIQIPFFLTPGELFAAAPNCDVPMRVYARLAKSMPP